MNSSHAPIRKMATQLFPGKTKVANRYVTDLFTTFSQVHASGGRLEARTQPPLDTARTWSNKVQDGPTHTIFPSTSNHAMTSSRDQLVGGRIIENVVPRRPVQSCEYHALWRCQDGRLKAQYYLCVCKATHHTVSEHRHRADNKRSTAVPNSQDLSHRHASNGEDQEFPVLGTSEIVFALQRIHDPRTRLVSMVPV